MYKVLYTINLLPVIGSYVEIDQQTGKKILVNDQIDFISMIGDIDEVEIFRAESIIELIKYKWDNYGFMWHFVGVIMHIIYLITITIFVKNVYVDTDEKDKGYFISIMLMGILYPFIYDSIQLYRVGFVTYFSEFWNYTDILFIWLGLTNIITHYIYDIHRKENIYLQVFVILLAIVKTFFFMRVFESLSFIVTKLKRVIYDL